MLLLLFPLTGKSPEGQTTINDHGTFEKIQENNVKIGLMEGLLVFLTLLIM